MTPDRRSLTSTISTVSSDSSPVGEYVDAETDSGVLKSRQFVYKELVDTEHDYIKDLSTVIDVSGGGGGRERGGGREGEGGRGYIEENEREEGRQREGEGGKEGERGCISLPPPPHRATTLRWTQRVSVFL